MKTSSQKSSSKFTAGRYILIVGAALILAIALYALLNVSDASEESGVVPLAISDTTNSAMAGVEPASFQQISEFRDSDTDTQKIRLSGNAEAGAIIVITNRGERLRQVRVNDLGQWGVTLDTVSDPMVLETLLYMEEDMPGIRSEETVFRLPIPATNLETGSETAPEAGSETVDRDEDTETSSIYKTPALIMVTAPGSPSRIIQSPFGGVPTVGPLSLSVIDYDSAGGVIITGKSSVPGRVRFYAQDAVINETGIGVGGRWNFIAGRMLPRAQINIRAELIPAAGAPNAPEERTSLTVPFNFLPLLQEEDTDGSGALSVNIEPTYWQIRRTLIGGGGQSTIIFAPIVAQ